MATYGTRDATRFEVNGVQYYTLVESDGPNKGQITVKSPTVAGNVGGANADRTVGTIPLDNAFRPAPGNATTSEVAYFSSAAGQKAVKNQAVITAQKAGAPDAQKLIFPNSATPDTPPSGSNPNSPTPDGQAEGSAIQEELGKGFKENTRKDNEYADVKYPLTLKLENQDCIKFSILKYVPPGIKPGSSASGPRIVKLQTGSKPGINGKPIATITLPIPAGIADRNPADWSSSSLDDITRAFSNIAMQSILKGGEGAVAATGQEIKTGPGGNTQSLESMLASKMVEEATGSSNILSRQFGAVINPNLELLFNGPSLRSFTFNFRFTPREINEAKAVRKIIRQFKQAMSVKRSASSLLLKAPHTFAISYLSNNKDHPYLNRFKECALTDCAVSYTPDGTYMTYTDSSMTAYELSLTFQELEPIFDDEYYEIDKNDDTSIGF